MPGYASYLAALIDYWGSVGENAAERVQNARQEILERRYTPGKLVSDLLGLWNDSLEAWWTALIASGTAPVPTVLFTVKLGPITTEAKARSVPVMALEDGAPSCTDLSRVGGPPTATIPSDHVKVVLGQARSELEVRLCGLREISLEPGHYLGLIHIEERPLAAVHVVVTPAGTI